MWRHLQRSCHRPLHPIYSRPYSQLPGKNVFTKHNISCSAPPELSSGKRIANVLIAFCAGFSIYFFLDEPASQFERPSNSPNKFILSKVISNEDSGPGTKLLKIAAPTYFLPHNNTANSFDPIWSVYIKDDDIQVERPYTPLNGVDENGQMTFWIKKYPNGEVGRWLHTKRIGEPIEFRGPLTTWTWREDTWDEVVMISGGTGITPFVQLFHNVISKSPNTKTRFTLLHSSRVPEELPPPSLLDPMITFSIDNPDKLKFHVFVDEQDGSEPSTSIPAIYTGRISENTLKRHVFPEEPKISWWMSLFTNPPPTPDPRSRRILFLVCGPEPMISAIAGPYGRNFSQGSVGGILGKLGIVSDQVYKL
ncbi:NADH-cytochrome b5 reductase 2 [Psilocybe cubensis]|uniref:NADH-cytochrome b5 reductase 2 n=2 Tax=Psilocybe cubensis TaxID=181762 RepID=A0ACB8H3F8_PSICU|nr:NADH-cytochrome b5 reductase 2 [Psilocybe cubensis]KAH9482406.1 NADH-cytochrome b5 reductase 2 [Psilocybe cubensis]